MQRTGETLKLKRFSRPTTVENLAHELFTEITEMGFRLNRLEIRETDTSVISYTREDWVFDNRYFVNPMRSEKSQLT
jgi:6-pyruvoyltetrahydropterin/6-carboxytetrahydropterin synthase